MVYDIIMEQNGLRNLERKTTTQKLSQVCQDYCALTDDF